MGFFDKIKEQASSLGSQIDQAIDGTKQKAQLNTLRKQRGELVAQLGEAILQQFREQQLNAAALRPQVDQIFSLEWEIIEQEKQIEVQRQAAAQAAAAPPPPPAAAAPAPPSPTAPPAAPQAGTRSCPSCGGEVPVDSAFCPNCGATVEG